MKKHVFLVLMIPFPLFAYNNNSNTIMGDSILEDAVKISVSKLTELENAKSESEKVLQMANKELLELKMKLKEDSVAIKSLSNLVSNLRADSISACNTQRELQEKLLKSDKCLISVASNFLYLPYEAYSVNNIAIRSFETISDVGMKKKYLIRYELLKNYKDDILCFLNFLITQKEELNKPFTKNAEDAIQSLRQLQFYIVYHKYDDWEATFLGKKIVTVEKQLKLFNGGTHKANFDIIISELQNCIETEKDL